MFSKILFSVPKGKDYLFVMQKLCQPFCLRARAIAGVIFLILLGVLDSNRLKKYLRARKNAESNQKVGRALGAEGTAGKSNFGLKKFFL